MREAERVVYRNPQCLWGVRNEMNNDLISRSALLKILRHCNDEPGDVESDEYFEWDNMTCDNMLYKIIDIVTKFPSAGMEA